MATSEKSGKDKDTKDTTSSAERSTSTGSGGGRAGAVGKSGVSGGFTSGSSASSSKSTGGGGRAGGVGRSDAGGGFSSGASSGSKSSGGSSRGSEGGRAGGVGRSDVGGGFSAPGPSGEGARYSGKGGLNSPGEFARATGGYGLNGSSRPSPDRPDNRNFAGPKGMGGVGGIYARGLMTTVNDSTDYAQFTAAHRASEDASMRALGALRAETARTMPDGASVREQDIQSMSALRDMNLDSWTQGIIGVESAGNPLAKNPLSSATGLGQFIGSTWTSMMEKYYPDVVAELSPKAVLDLRLDPTYSRAMTKAYLDENVAQLEELGLPVTPGTAYMTHFLGPGAAVQTLQADPSTPMSSIVGAGQIAANRSILSGKTAGDVIGWADRKMEKNLARASTPVASDEPANPDFAGITPQESIERQYAYAGQTRSLAPSEPVSNRAERFREKYVSPSYSAAEQGLPPGTPGTRDDASVTASTTVSPSVERSTVQPVGPGSAISPSRTAGAAVSPRTAATATPVTARESAPPVRERSIPQRVAATGVDVLAGLLPGAGIAASIFNTGAALTGRRTIGERTVDAFADGTIRGGSSTPTGPREGDTFPRDRSEYSAPPTVVEEPVATAPVPDVNRFRRLYLTPEQKWGRSRGLMSAA